MLDWLENVLGDYGYPLVFLAVLLNNLGVPVPGDSFLLAAGWLCAEGYFPFGGMVAVGTAACFLGGTAGYEMGRRVGRKMLRRSRWFRLKPERFDRMDRFFKKYGAKAVFFARFVALVHPVTGLLAGMGRIPRRPFLFYNLAGSAAYALIYVSAGYLFGDSWNLLAHWAGRAAVYTLAAVLALVLFNFLLRQPLGLFWERLSRKGSK